MIFFKSFFIAFGISTERTLAMRRLSREEHEILTGGSFPLPRSAEFLSIDIASIRIPISYNLSREEVWAHRYHSSISPPALSQHLLASSRMSPPSSRRKKKNHTPCIASVQSRENLLPRRASIHVVVEGRSIAFPLGGRCPRISRVGPPPRRR